MNTFDTIYKSLEVLNAFKAFVAIELLKYKMDMGHCSVDSMPDGTIEVHALVTERGCECMQYIHMLIEKGDDDEFKIHPPVVVGD